jgi:hypothetical protein
MPIEDNSASVRGYWQARFAADTFAFGQLRVAGWRDLRRLKPGNLTLLPIDAVELDPWRVDSCR